MRSDRSQGVFRGLVIFYLAAMVWMQTTGMMDSEFVHLIAAAGGFGMLIGGFWALIALFNRNPPPQ